MIWLPPCTATVTFQSPSRSACCSRCSTSTSHLRSVSRHSNSSASSSRRRSPDGSCMSGCCTSTKCRRTTGLSWMSWASASLRTTWRCSWLADGTSMTTSPSTWVEHDSRMPSSIGWVLQYSCSTALNADRCSGRERTPCLANSPTACVTWQRPQMPRPPQTESMSTPSERAACSTMVPTGNRPRRPEGVKTTNGSFVLMWPPRLSLRVLRCPPRGLISLGAARREIAVRACVAYRPSAFLALRRAGVSPPRAGRGPFRHRLPWPAPRGTCGSSACSRGRGPSSRRPT